MAAPSHPPAIAPTPAPTAAPAPAPIAVFLPGVAHPPRTTTADRANRKWRIRISSAASVTGPPGAGALTGTVELALRVPCRSARRTERAGGAPGALESTDFDPSCSAIRQQAKHRRRPSYRTKVSSGASLPVLARGGPVDWASAVHPHGPVDHGSCAAAHFQSAGSSNEFRIWHDGC